MVVGTFTLVVSLSVGQGIERAIVTLFHQDDRLRKIAASATFQENAEDVPESEREPVDPDERGETPANPPGLGAELAGDVALRGRSNRLDASAIRRIGAIGHMARIEPMGQFDGTAKTGRERAGRAVGLGS